MKPTLTALGALVLGLALADCRRPQTVVVEDNTPATPIVIERRSPPPNTVIVAPDHVHAATCGHYFYNGHWYYDPAHMYLID
jgi:hypothetical protein